MPTPVRTACASLPTINAEALSNKGVPPAQPGTCRRLACSGALSCGCVLRRLLYHFSWLGGPHLYPLLECHCRLDSWPGNSKVTASTPVYPTSCCLSYRRSEE